MARKITISFKETKKDLELFEYLSKLEDKSAEIKSLLRKVLVKENNAAKEEKIVESKNNNIDILDF